MRSDFTALRRRLDSLVWALLPGVCILCNARSHVMADLCEACRVALPWIERACRHCALPLTDGEQICAACRAHPPPFARSVPALRYVEPVTRMIHRLKFGGSRVDARVIGSLLAARIRDEYRHEALPDVVVPVPLSRERLRRRGHNQAALLARWVAGSIDVPIDHRGCRRIVHTQPQTGLSRSARLRNLTDAFSAVRPFTHLRVAVVDDVMTTGSTVTALTRTLLAAGADDVHVWIAARTPRPAVAT